MTSSVGAKWSSWSFAVWFCSLLSNPVIKIQKMKKFKSVLIMLIFYAEDEGRWIIFGVHFGIFWAANLKLLFWTFVICTLHQLKPKSKTQNLKPKIILLFLDFFIKKLYYYFGFFWNNLTKIPVFTKKISSLVFGFLVF